jgi:hypothetical protein
VNRGKACLEKKRKDGLQFSRFSLSVSAFDCGHLRFDSQTTEESASAHRRFFLLCMGRRLFPQGIDPLYSV